MMKFDRGVDEYGIQVLHKNDFTISGSERSAVVLKSYILDNERKLSIC